MEALWKHYGNKIIHYGLSNCNIPRHFRAHGDTSCVPIVRYCRHNATQLYSIEGCVSFVFSSDNYMLLTAAINEVGRR